MKTVIRHFEQPLERLFFLFDFQQRSQWAAKAISGDRLQAKASFTRKTPLHHSPPLPAIKMEINYKAELIKALTSPQYKISFAGEVHYVKRSLRRTSCNAHIRSVNYCIQRQYLIIFCVNERRDSFFSFMVQMSYCPLYYSMPSPEKKIKAHVTYIGR